MWYVCPTIITNKKYGLVVLTISEGRLRQRYSRVTELLKPESIPLGTVKFQGKSPLNVDQTISKLF